MSAQQSEQDTSTHYDAIVIGAGQAGPGVAAARTPGAHGTGRL